MHCEGKRESKGEPLLADQIEYWPIRLSRLELMIYRVRTAIIAGCLGGLVVSMSPSCILLDLCSKVTGSYGVNDFSFFRCPELDRIIIIIFRAIVEEVGIQKNIYL